jgi:hypothetical protein
MSSTPPLRVAAASTVQSDQAMQQQSDLSNDQLTDNIETNNAALQPATTTQSISMSAVQPQIANESLDNAASNDFTNQQQQLQSQPSDAPIYHSNQASFDDATPAYVNDVAVPIVPHSEAPASTAPTQASAPIDSSSSSSSSAAAIVPHTSLPSPSSARVPASNDLSAPLISEKRSTRGLGRRQLFAMLHKHWLIKRRSYAQTACEIIAPLLLVLVLVFGYNLSTNN